MTKPELLNLVKDPDVIEALREALFGSPIPASCDSNQVAIMPLRTTNDMITTQKVAEMIRSIEVQQNRKGLPVARIAWERAPSWVTSIMVCPSGKVWGCDRQIDPNFKQPIAGKYVMLCHDYRGYSDALLLDNCELPLYLDRGRDRTKGGTQVFMLTPKNLDEHVRKVGAPVIDKVYPEQDIIPWDVLDPRWKFAFRTPSGESFVSQFMPTKVDFGWKKPVGAHERISGLLSGFVVGACPWYNSLQERPNA